MARVRPVIVERLGGEDWARLRELRLASLLDTPDAFWALHADQARWSEADWRAAIGDAAWFAARRPSGGDLGVIAGADSPEWGEPGGRLLGAMWVEPESRGTGVAESLVEALCAWARAEGAATLTLWVATGNVRARAFYRRLGFVGTGRTAPLREGSDIVCDELRLVL